jgi:type I restriction enzyme, S subunit
VDLKHVVVVRPPLDDQHAIVELLRAYDDLIENNRRRIALLEQAARLLYKEWFVRFRFPGHEHVAIIDNVPDGWERLPLGEVLTLQRGFDLPSSQRKEGIVPVIASTGPNGFHDEVKVKGPGVVTGRSGSLGTVLLIQDDFWPLNTTLWVKEFKRVSPHFAYFLLGALKPEQFGGGAAVPTLNRNDLHRIEILCPAKRLIDDFSSYVLTIFEQVEKLKQLNIKLAQARDLLLPRLMNGELAV